MIMSTSRCILLEHAPIGDQYIHIAQQDVLLFYNTTYRIIDMPIRDRIFCKDATGSFDANIVYRIVGTYGMFNIQESVLQLHINYI
jgi:hypothetical protein